MSARLSIAGRTADPALEGASPPHRVGHRAAAGCALSSYENRPISSGCCSWADERPCPPAAKHATGSTTRSSSPPIKASSGLCRRRWTRCSRRSDGRLLDVVDIGRWASRAHAEPGAAGALRQGLPPPYPSHPGQAHTSAPSSARRTISRSSPKAPSSSHFATPNGTCWISRPSTGCGPTAVGKRGVAAEAVSDRTRSGRRPRGCPVSSSRAIRRSRRPADPAR